MQGKPTFNIAMRWLFPTPVAALLVPDAAPRNEGLRTAILKHRDESPSIQASNAGGWHSDRNLAQWGGTDATAILDIARVVASRLTTDRQGNQVSIDWKVTAWANINPAGAANICHYHPGSVWSGTYYVDDGGCAEDETLGGEFEMLDPRGGTPSMFAPTLAFAGEGGLSAGATESIRPKPGLMVLFPSWLFHQVRPYRGTRERISVAFNLSV
jgi:uncharacterized protein (TIGR02466 family)